MLIFYAKQLVVSNSLKVSPILSDDQNHEDNIKGEMVLHVKEFKLKFWNQISLFIDKYNLFLRDT